MKQDLTSDSIDQMLISSGLLPEQKVRELRQHFRVQTSTPDGLLSLLQSRQMLTDWQINKLKQGRHRGFFLGPYKLLSHLARGGMSTLYVAEHPNSGGKCALKVLPPSKAMQASYLPRFLREAELATRLRHPNIMQVHDVMTCSKSGQQIYFMVMELLEGADLFNTVANHGPLTVYQAAEVIRQTAIGLQHAHDAGLVHRDVKPGNIFISHDGTVKIVDLGLAAIQEGHSESLTRQHDERVLGTADYLAPEQAIDSHRADWRADIYALGCAFYYALAGRPPFTEGTLAQRLVAHQTLDPRDISEHRSDIPDAIRSLLKSMFVKRRVNRIQTCQEVADILGRVLETDPERLRQPPQMIVYDPLSSRPRKLKRVRKADKSETPTDSLRASDATTTTTPGREADNMFDGIDQAESLINEPDA